MASESIEEVFGEVLAEHYKTGGGGCLCGEPRTVDLHAHRAHIAEQLSARLEQVGWINDVGSIMAPTEGAGYREYAAQHAWDPVFRVKEQRDE